MLHLSKDLQEAAAAAIKTVFDIEVEPSSLSIQETRKDFEGDLTIVVFPLTRYKLGAPHIIADKLGQYLVEQVDMIAAYSVVKGFLNLVIHPDFWLKFVANYHQKDAFFQLTEGEGQKVMVEYSSPNTNKPLHLGHLRNIILGNSLSQLLKTYGYEVIEACLYNDRGTAICKSMYAWTTDPNPQTPESAGKAGDLVVGDYYVRFANMLDAEVEKLMQEEGLDKEEAKKKAPSNLAIQELLVEWEEEKPEVRKVWQMMNDWVYKAHKHTYKRLGVDFDQFYYESDLYQKGKEYVLAGLEKEAFYKKEDGSIWVDLEPDGLDQKLLLRSNGTALYITQDIATAFKKAEDYQIDRSVYVVGNEQDYHFKVLFLVLQKLGLAGADGLHHMSYGMVDLPSGKMKSREGTAVDAEDLLDKMEKLTEDATKELGKIEGLSEDELQELYRILGVGALKYFLVKVEPRKRILFDPNESIDLHGNTGPFIQYSYARSNSVTQKAENADFDLPSFTDETKLEEDLHESERELIKAIYQYRKVVKDAAENYNPAAIANYVYELAKVYNRFYHDCRILVSANPNTSAMRYTLSIFAGKTIRKSMEILGIEVPERM